MPLQELLHRGGGSGAGGWCSVGSAVLLQGLMELILEPLDRVWTVHWISVWTNARHSGRGAVHGCSAAWMNT